MIEPSVQIYSVKQRPVAHLPFTKKPCEYLADNYLIAMENLHNAVTKYGNDAKATIDVIGAF